MGKWTVPDLKELFRQASEIARDMPDSMQEAAFNRAVDLLIASTQPASVDGRANPKRPADEKTSKPADDEVEKTTAADLISVIDSTQHPGIISTSKALDRALMVLRIALRDHGVDGLAPSEISRILTDKFRISTPSSTIRMALTRAPRLVDRVADGSSFAFKIMGPGEEYLAHLNNEGDSSSAATQNTGTKTKAPGQRSKQAKSSQRANKAPRAPAQKRPQKSGMGPKAAVVDLIDSGYFTKGRTSPEVKTYLKDKRGFNIDAGALRVTLLRLVRDEVLVRDVNEEGQYEYRSSKA